MIASDFSLEATDGAKLFVRKWMPDSPPRAIVQIAHGLAEHSGRYAGFAQALAAAGIGVYANDHRGHGRTSAPDDFGFFGARDGWRLVYEDLWTLNRRIAAENSGIPQFFFGHSMGSFMGQMFIADHGDALAGAILSGSNGRPPALATIGRFIALAERARLGPKGKSPLLQKLMFGEFNKAFAPNRTAFDWLSRDNEQVDAYIADPLCGFEYTTQLVLDLLGGLRPLLTSATVSRIPKTLPVFIFSGMRDPVGGNIQSLIDTYREARLTTEVQLYTDARHEMLNELNKDEVISRVIAWIDGILSKSAKAA